MSKFMEKLTIVNGICSLEIVPDKLKTEAKVDLADYWLIYRKGAYAEEMYDLLKIPKDYLLKFKGLLEDNYKIKTGRDFRSVSEAVQDHILCDRNRLENIIEIPVKWFIANKSDDIEKIEDCIKSVEFLLRDNVFRHMAEFICRFCKTYIGKLSKLTTDLKSDIKVSTTEIEAIRIICNDDNFDNYNQKGVVLEAFTRDITKLNEYANKSGEERNNIVKDIEYISALNDTIYQLFNEYDSVIDDNFKSKVMELDSAIHALKSKLGI